MYCVVTALADNVACAAAFTVSALAALAKDANALKLNFIAIGCR